MARSDSTGKCELCGHRGPKSGMARHLAECAPAHDSRGTAAPVVQLRVDAAGDARYWLHIEASADATLEQVDTLLRRVWLECCGHMSAFHVGQVEPSKRSKVGSVLTLKGLRFRYEYDLGSTTELNGQVVGVREGSPGRHTVRLLARNDPLTWCCAECEASATIVCPFCTDEDDGLFCDAHAAKHSHAKEEVFLPAVNSPRMGMCGYTG